MDHNQHLAEFDPEIAALLDAELSRQQTTLEMIASENFAPVAALQAQGSVLTNKYAEGYPGKRYYGGCEVVDQVEQIAIDRLKQLFDADYANVQPHSGRLGQCRRPACHRARRRHDPGPRPRQRRAPHPRHEAQLLRPPVRGRAVPRRRAGPGRHGGGARSGDRALAQGHHRRLVGLPAPARLRCLPRDRRRGRRHLVGRHGPLRRSGRCGTAPQPHAARPCRVHHDAQDAGRPSRRRDLVQRSRSGQEAAVGGLPRPAGRPAGARHRGQGGRLQDGARP